MLPNASDNCSPWYEAFSPRPHRLPALWVTTPAAEPAPGQARRAANGKPPADEPSEWATEAIFDYYNS